MKTDHFDDYTGGAMEALRRLTLRSRLAISFDSLIHQASAMRCVSVGRAVQDVVGDSVCEQIIRESGLMQYLRDEAIARSSGGAIALPPLLPEIQPRTREALHAG